jgi:hypothetical protein
MSERLDGQVAVLVVDAGGEVIGDERFVEMDTRLVSEAGQTS